MKKVTLVLFAMSIFGTTTFAQIKKTTTASVAFDATTPTDDWPRATNNSVVCAINTKNGKIEFKLDINNFSFKDNNAKIKEHWLDPKCMNGAKFPNATFAGKITNPKAVNFKKDGVYNVTVSGNLKLHGVVKPLSTPATITVANGALTANAEFTLTSADFGVSHPGEGGGKVSKTPKLKIVATLK